MGKLLYKGLFVIFLLLFLAGCLHLDKLVSFIRPAGIDIPQRIKNIAVISRGENADVIGDMVTQAFVNFDSSDRFTLVDRENIDDILDEQALSNSFEFDENEAVEIGKLSGAHGIVFVEVKNLSEKTENGNVVIKRKYKDKFIKEVYGVKIYSYKYIPENLPSIVKTYFFDVSIKIIDAETGSILHSISDNINIKYENYTDNKPEHFSSVEKKNAPFIDSFPDMREIVSSVVKGRAKQFVQTIAPYTISTYISFEKIGNDDINSTFIRYVDNDLFDEAFEFMNKNLDNIEGISNLSNRGKHFYNLACVYEIMGDLTNSYEFYKKAVEDNPNDLHLAALREIKIRLEDAEKLSNQVK